MDLYTQAIELTPENAILYANRAAAHMRLENYGAALGDASLAIEKDPRYIKACFPCCPLHRLVSRIKVCMPRAVAPLFFVVQDTECVLPGLFLHDCFCEHSAGVREKKLLSPCAERCMGLSAMWWQGCYQ